MFVDANGDRIQQGTEADSPGRVVTVTDAFGVDHTGTTNSTGGVTIAAVPAGTATVSVSVPSGTVVTTQNQSQSVSIVAGTVAPASPLGYQARGSVTGHVFVDTTETGPRIRARPTPSG